LFQREKIIRTEEFQSPGEIFKKTAVHIERRKEENGECALVLTDGEGRVRRVVRVAVTPVGRSTAAGPIHIGGIHPHRNDAGGVVYFSGKFFCGYTYRAVLVLHCKLNLSSSRQIPGYTPNTGRPSREGYIMPEILMSNMAAHINCI
jgi:hypothetical protein